MEASAEKTTSRWYKASEFARLTGVTVRTLHHYDRLGLLKPSGHTAAGYRLYGERDFARLQQIVILKFIGFPLNQIKEILDRDSLPLPSALRLQRRILAEKRRQLDLAIVAIEKVERALASNGEPDWESFANIFANIVEALNMQNDMEWVKKYYTGDGDPAEERIGIAWDAGTVSKSRNREGRTFSIVHFRFVICHCRF